MAVWFGHTQTLTSISKSVSTVASGILGLEDNVATFMKKVIYYDKFFQRVRPNLPKEVTITANRLFARCYEYRDEVRDELESSLAYVADAGRWVVGMEDWNSKMDKRLHQINELVLLANTLLVEYAMTGKLGGEGSKEELDAYLRNIDASVVLKNHTKKGPVKPATKATIAQSSTNTGNALAGSTSTLSTESLKKEASPSLFGESLTGSGDALVLSVSSDAGENNRSADGNTPVTPTNEASDPAGSASTVEEDEDYDDDILNPFAVSYQPPVDKYSLESSLASLAQEPSSQGSSIPDLAAYDAEADSSQHLRDDAPDGPDSPVSLGEYECLELDAIPKYDAFKPSIRSRLQRMRTAQASAAGELHVDKSPSSSVISSHSSSNSGLQQQVPRDAFVYPAAMHDSFHSSASTSPSKETSMSANGSAAGGFNAKRVNRIMDMNYSYDFQREQDFNPFVSPPAVFLQDERELGGIESISELDLSSTPGIEEELPQLPPCVEAKNENEESKTTITMVHEEESLHLDPYTEGDGLRRSTALTEDDLPHLSETSGPKRSTALTEDDLPHLSFSDDEENDNEGSRSTVVSVHEERPHLGFYNSEDNDKARVTPVSKEPPHQDFYDDGENRRTLSVPAQEEPPHLDFYNEGNDRTLSASVPEELPHLDFYNEESNTSDFARAHIASPTYPSEQDETDALLAALAAASMEDYNLFALERR
uniref:Uncharacterized protein n=1 Tax=Globisporangium ultimum (strain ATCC 200006 / CBS 805.95 / DAOM BR144) TaxID=431595 RepID=K3XAS4_GLOUD